MADVDLIPASYRRRRRMTRWLSRFGIGYVVLLLALGAAKAYLVKRIDAQASTVQRLHADKGLVVGRKQRLAALRAERAVLAKRVAVLRRLRGGPPVQQVFLSIDRALDGTVWFLDWRFFRAGEFLPPGPRTVNTGYFIVVPGGQPGAREKAWQMRAHMQIRGRAVSHTALADFVQRLARQPVVADVKLLSTRTIADGAARAVGFELAALVRAGAAAS